VRHISESCQSLPTTRYFTTIPPLSLLTTSPLPSLLTLTPHHRLSMSHTLFAHCFHKRWDRAESHIKNLPPSLAIRQIFYSNGPGLTPMALICTDRSAPPEIFAAIIATTTTRNRTPLSIPSMSRVPLQHAARYHSIIVLRLLINAYPLALIHKSADGYDALKDAVEAFRPSAITELLRKSGRREQTRGAVFLALEETRGFPRNVCENVLGFLME